MIILQNGFSPDQHEGAGPQAPVWHKSNALRFMRANQAYSGKLITHGTLDHQIVPEVAPRPGDLVVQKSRYRGFAGTQLEQALHIRRIRMVLAAAVATNVCVERTIHDAYYRVFFTVMATDTSTAAEPGMGAAT